MNYQSIVQLFRIQPLQHGQHGGGLGAGGNGVQEAAHPGDGVVTAFRHLRQSRRPWRLLL